MTFMDWLVLIWAAVAFSPGVNLLRLQNRWLCYVAEVGVLALILGAMTSSGGTTAGNLRGQHERGLSQRP